jgi:3'-phosphoadenosine 5'-phosphosulfate sulfotransferase (PAPS reductase)/FAD synthetase
MKELQNKSLEEKVGMTAERVEKWFLHWNGYADEEKRSDITGIHLSFSGGKDSTVLRHIIKSYCYGVTDCPSVFVDTGLEYPEIREFAVANADIILKPEMNFRQVIKQYGYPIIGKKQSRAINDLQNANGKNNATVNLRLTGYNRKGEYCPSYKLAQKWHYLKDAPFKISDKCCDIIKKNPLYKYQKMSSRAPITAVTCEESNMRMRTWLNNGCNMYNASHPVSNPMSFWTEQDVLRYIANEDIEISAIYGKIEQDINGKLYTTGESRTGCMFCAFGAHLDSSPNRFQRMKETHPTQYNFCMKNCECGGLGMKQVLEYISVKVD